MILLNSDFEQIGHFFSPCVFISCSMHSVHKIKEAQDLQEHIQYNNTMCLKLLEKLAIVLAVVARHEPKLDTDRR